MSTVSNRIRREAERLEKWDNSKDISELLSVISEGDILELGCGTGKIIEELSKTLRKSKFTGIDIEEYFIQIAKQKNLPNAVFQQGDAVDHLFSDSSFDTVIFRDSLKFIPRQRGQIGLTKCLETVFDYLRTDGRFIIRDGMKPPSTSISMHLGTDENIQVFKIYAQRNPVIPEKNGYVTMNLPDLISFLSKYRKIKENTYTSPRNPDPPTYEEYDTLLTNIGFKKEIVKTYPYPTNLIPEGITVETDLPDTYIMFVYQKP